MLGGGLDDLTPGECCAWVYIGSYVRRVRDSISLGLSWGTSREVLGKYLTNTTCQDCQQGCRRDESNHPVPKMVSRSLWTNPEYNVGNQGTWAAGSPLDSFNKEKAHRPWRKSSNSLSHGGHICLECKRKADKESKTGTDFQFTYI
jgi:hypothetical protein